MKQPTILNTLIAMTTTIMFSCFVAILSINRLSRWSISHIFVEIVKGHPSLTYFDTGTAIMIPNIPLWIKTTPFHFGPGTVDATLLSIFGLSVSHNIHCTIGNM